MVPVTILITNLSTLNPKSSIGQEINYDVDFITPKTSVKASYTNDSVLESLFEIPDVKEKGIDRVIALCSWNVKNKRLNPIVTRLPLNIIRHFVHAKILLIYFQLIPQLKMKTIGA